MKTLLLATAAVLALSGAAAAQTKAPSTSTSCPSTGNAICNGLEVGIDIGADGTGSPGTPVALPSTAGGILGGWIGYKYWNPNQAWYLGFGADVLYDGTATAPAGLFLQTVEFGGSLQNFFTGPTAPSQGPITVGPFTALAPFVLAGGAEKYANGVLIEGWATGAGVIWPIGGQWDLKTRYIYVSYGSGTNEQLAIGTLAYHF